MESHLVGKVNAGGLFGGGGGGSMKFIRARI